MRWDKVNVWRSALEQHWCSAHLSAGNGALSKWLWQQVSSIQHSVCHSCQSPDRDLSTASSLVRQTGWGTHTQTHWIAWLYLHEHTHAHTRNNIVSRLVRAHDIWIAGRKENTQDGNKFHLLSLHHSYLCWKLSCCPYPLCLNWSVFAFCVIFI